MASAAATAARGTASELERRLIESQKSGSRATKSLESEVSLLERQVVLDLVECKSRQAAPAQVGHLHLASRPDPLDVSQIGIGQPSYHLILDVGFDLRDGVVVLAN